MKKNLLITLLLTFTLLVNTAYSRPLKGEPHKGPKPPRGPMHHMAPPMPPHHHYYGPRHRSFIYYNSYCPIGCNCINYSTITPRSSFGFAISI